MSKLAAKLAAKLETNTAIHSAAAHGRGIDLGRSHVKIKVNQIDPNPYQPRKVFPDEELEQLAMSIGEIGLLQPILVRSEGDRYQLIAGERRWRAHQRLGKETIDAILQQADDDEMAIAALAENIDRADLSDYEIAKALHDVEKLFPTKSQLASCLGMSRTDMYKYFSFDVLPDFVIEFLDRNPRLIGRRVATAIKQLLTETNGSPESLAALQQGLGLLEAGSLEQMMLPDYVKVACRRAPMRSAAATNDFLDAKGKKVGSVRRAGHNVIYTIRAGALDVVKQQALDTYIARLISGEV